jgi:hypothetical protein
MSEPIERHMIQSHGAAGAHGSAGAQASVYGEQAETHGSAHGATVHLPRPTAWPIVLALGFALLVSGVLTHYGIGILGAVLTVWACVGWFREVLPHESHEDIPVVVQEVAVHSSRRTVARISVSEENRAHLPVETFPITAGLKGGIAGGIAMIIPAEIYGLIAQHSLWYPINLLGGAGIVDTWRDVSVRSLDSFHPKAFVAAVLIHIVSSVLIGLLYGAVLPILPRHPIVLGGIVAPLFWTGLLHSTLHTIDPAFASHIAWGWFTTSQFVFGIVAGWVVSRSPHVRTAQSLPFAMRLGLETPGLLGGGKGEKR